MDKYKYTKMIERFELRYPHFYNKMISWWASGRISIAVKLSDGSVLDYNDVDNTIRWVTLGEFADEESERIAFGCNLQKFVTHCGMSKSELAEKLGVTNAMLSRYLHGKTMPSASKARHLAQLLGCSIDEFFDETYAE